MEVRSSGIYVQTLHPGYVQSNMSRLRRPTFRGPSAENYVNAAIATLGIESRTAGYWYHKILVSHCTSNCCFKLFSKLFKQMYWAEMGYFFFPAMVAWRTMAFLKAYRENTLKKLKNA